MTSTRPTNHEQHQAADELSNEQPVATGRGRRRAHARDAVDRSARAAGNGEPLAEVSAGSATSSRTQLQKQPFVGEAR